MPNYFPHLWLVLLVGYSLVGCGRPTPAPIAEDVALQHFLNSAPSLVRPSTTPTPVNADAFGPSSGLPLPLIDPLDVTGDLLIAGSPALAPLTRLLYADFVSAGYRDTIRIDELSSDVVFQRYCTQATGDNAAVDIVMADRLIKQSEVESCRQHNRTLIALRIGVEAVVLVAHRDTDFVTNLSKAELAALMMAHRWSDLHPDWPNRQIIRFVPTEEHRESALFIDKILASNAVALRTAPGVTFLEAGQEIANAVADTPNAIGLLNFADYQKDATELRIIAIDGITPRPPMAVDGAYPLVYPLLLYTDVTTLLTRPQVVAFLLYYLANINGRALAKAGSFPVNEAVYERNKVVLLTALGQKSYLAQFTLTSTPIPLLTAAPVVTPLSVLTNTVTLTRAGALKK